MSLIKYAYEMEVKRLEENGLNKEAGIKEIVGSIGNKLKSFGGGNHADLFNKAMAPTNQRNAEHFMTMSLAKNMKTGNGINAGANLMGLKAPKEMVEQAKQHLKPEDLNSFKSRLQNLNVSKAKHNEAVKDMMGYHSVLSNSAARYPQRPRPEFDRPRPKLHFPPLPGISHR